MSYPAGRDGAALQKHICDIDCTGAVCHAYPYGDLRNGAISCATCVNEAIEIPPSDQVYKSCFRCSVLVFKCHLNAHLSIRTF